MTQGAERTAGGGLELRFLCLLSHKWSRDKIEGSGDFEAFLSALVT